MNDEEVRTLEQEALALGRADARLVAHWLRQPSKRLDMGEFEGFFLGLVPVTKKVRGHSLMRYDFWIDGARRWLYISDGDFGIDRRRMLEMALGSSDSSECLGKRLRVTVEMRRAHAGHNYLLIQFHPTWMKWKREEHASPSRPQVRQRPRLNVHWMDD